MTITARERFLSVCSQRIPGTGDVIVVLCGEDATPRLEMACALFARGFAPLICVSGGRHDPPRYLDADHCRSKLIGMGIAPDRIAIENASQHTRDQAVNVLALAKANGWTRIVLVASAFHSPRASLTFLAALKERGELATVRLIPAYVSSAWHEPPTGMERERLELLASELGKVEQYASLGHVLSYEEGVAYFKALESKP